MHDFLLSFYRFMDPVFLTYFTIINLIYTFLSIIGAIGTFRRVKEVNTEDFTTIVRSNSLPKLTFIVPTYNDSKAIITCIENLTRLIYRYKQIIIVNDGSTDDTFQILFDYLRLKPIPIFFTKKLPSKRIRGIYRSEKHPEIIVMDKDNGEKYDALNAALSACETDYFVVMDSDSYIEDLEFEALIRPIFTSPKNIAIGAAVKIKNGCDIEWNKINTENFPKDFIAAIQAIEYLRTFLMRVGWDSINGNFIVSGAFGVFSKDVVIQAGGYGPTIANDLEIILRLNRVMRATKTPYHVVYLPDPVSWTEGPRTWKELAAQRIRWQRGLLESLWFHKSVIFNPRYGIQGLFVHPFLVLFEAFEPLVEIAGYIYIFVGWLFGVVNPLFILTFILVTMGFVFVQTLFALLMEEFSFRKYPSLRSIFMLFLYSLVESLGYRQMTLIWRAQGFFSFFKRYREIKKDSQRLNQYIKKLVKKGQIHW